jgi:hypothetical protein
MDRYLSVCAIYLDEGPYLREWIEFHKLVGVERFYMYDHESTDGHLDALAPYIEDGTVVLHDWPVQPGQLEAYDHCVETHGDETRWMAFIDIDEFLFSPTYRPLPEILSGYEQHAAVAVNWAMFGTSGHRTKPDGLVIENYHLRKDYDVPGRDGAPRVEHVKCVVDPRRTARCIGPHSFEYKDGVAVTEHGRPLDTPPFGLTSPVTWDLLRINHYARRSEEEYLRKLARPRADTGEFKNKSPERHEQRERTLNAVRDDTIKRYVPDVRRALDRVEAALRPSAGAGGPSSART